MGILALIAEFENDIRREPGIKRALAHLMSWNVRFGSLADIGEACQGCPLYPQKQTCSWSASMSAKCQ
jgi:hypothetical protein